MEELNSVLAGNRYPGRGVLWCRTTDGALLGAYFLTGRSPASKARALRLHDGQLIVAPSDAREHDNLRHYVAARQSGARIVFGNGEQVDAVADRLDAGDRPLQALDGLDYEPDPPIFTPRITVVADGDGSAWLAQAAHSAGERSATNRTTVAVGGLQPGEGVLLTTYLSDGTAIATAAPFTEVTVGARAELLDGIWSALSADLRVAATVFAPDALDQAEIRQEPAE